MRASNEQTKVRTVFRDFPVYLRTYYNSNTEKDLSSYVNSVLKGGLSLLEFGSLYLNLNLFVSNPLLNFGSLQLVRQLSFCFLKKNSLTLQHQLSRKPLMLLCAIYVNIPVNSSFMHEIVLTCSIILYWGVAKRCRLSWLANSALVYDFPRTRGVGEAGSFILA
jgi:hypothetical protein